MPSGRDTSRYPLYVHVSTQSSIIYIQVCRRLGSPAGGRTNTYSKDYDPHSLNSPPGGTAVSLHGSRHRLTNQIEFYHPRGFPSRLLHTVNPLRRLLQLTNTSHAQAHRQSTNLSTDRLTKESLPVFNLGSLLALILLLFSL